MKPALKIVAAVLVTAAAALAACEKPIVAPDDKGVCWHVVTNKDGTLKFNRLASNVENMETCAATLEGMRLRFARLGSTNNELTGAYQSNFIFLQKEGVFTSRTMSSAHFPFLVRTGDGRLAIPSAMKQDPANPPVVEPNSVDPLPSAKQGR